MHYMLYDHLCLRQTATACPLTRPHHTKTECTVCCCCLFYSKRGVRFIYMCEHTHTQCTHSTLLHTHTAHTTAHAEHILWATLISLPAPAEIQAISPVCFPFFFGDCSQVSCFCWYFSDVNYLEENCGPQLIAGHPCYASEKVILCHCTHLQTNLCDEFSKPLYEQCCPMMSTDPVRTRTQVRLGSWCVCCSACVLSSLKSVVSIACSLPVCVAALCSTWRASCVCVCCVS